VRDDVVEVKLKPSLGEGGKARAPSHAHGGWWRAVGAAERSTHWSSPSSLASISRHAFVKRSASHTTFEIVLAVETRRSPRSLLVSCRISDACDVMRRRRRESDMAMRALPRQNSATMETYLFIRSTRRLQAMQPCQGPCHRALGPSTSRVIGMIRLVNALGMSWTVRNAKLMDREEKKKRLRS